MDDSIRSRAEIIANKEEYDLLIIGGGIVGAGIARDAAMRGMKTLLVEQKDFAFGTSSRSSRLLHGGIRYLAQGRVGLVREASREKKILHKIAPHLAEPLPFLFPTYRGTSWAKWKLRIGVTIYDWLCGGENLGRSTALTKRQIGEQFPMLTQKGLTGAVRYFDGMTNDSRLVIDNIAAAAYHDASVLNYCKYINATREESHWKIQLHDELENREFEVTAKSIVNATGPWSHKIPNSKTQLRPTKGSHLVIDREKLPVPDAVVVVDGKRILFSIPWGDRVVLGTTDTDYDGPLGSPKCTQEDIDYILGIMNRAYPDANLKPSDIISTWSGLRPLPYVPNAHPSDISREHEIKVSQPGWIDITGGKLTTYRLIAQQAVDQVQSEIGKEFERCKTARWPLLEEKNPYSTIVPPPVEEKVVKNACEKEWAINLDDVMLRRTRWGYYFPNQEEIATQVASWMGLIFNWDKEKIDQEVQIYLELQKPDTDS